MLTTGVVYHWPLGCGPEYGQLATNTEGELVFALHATRRQGQCKSCDDRRTREFTILCHYFTHITSSGDLARTPLFGLSEIFQPR